MIPESKKYYAGEESTEEEFLRKCGVLGVAPYDLEGLFAGRFMPYHNGHFRTHKRVGEHYSRMHIGIVNPNPWHTKLRGEKFTLDKNFLEYYERLEMIWSATEQLGLSSKTTIGPYFPAAHYDEEAYWNAIPIPPHQAVLILAIRDDFDEKKFARYQARKMHMEVVPVISDADSIDYSATRIRKLMLEGEEWRKLVPSFTAHVIDKYRIVARLKDLTADARRKM